MNDALITPEEAAALSGFVLSTDIDDALEIALHIAGERGLEWLHVGQNWDFAVVVSGAYCAGRVQGIREERRRRAGKQPALMHDPMRRRVKRPRAT